MSTYWKTKSRKEFSGLSAQENQNRIVALRQEIFKLTMQKNLGRLTDNQVLWRAKKDLSRLMTFASLKSTES